MEMTENTITISFRSQRHLQRKVVAMLLSWGYTVMPPTARATKMIDLRLELGIPASTLHKLLARPECPPFPGKTANARRRNEIMVTPKLRAWLVARVREILSGKPAPKGKTPWEIPESG